VPMLKMRAAIPPRPIRLQEFHRHNTAFIFTLCAS